MAPNDDRFGPEGIHRDRVLAEFAGLIQKAQRGGWRVEVQNRFGNGPDPQSGDGEDLWGLTLLFVHDRDPFAIAIPVEVDGRTGDVAPEWCEVLVVDETRTDSPDAFSGRIREPLLWSDDSNDAAMLLEAHREGVAVQLLERWLAAEPDERNTRAVSRYLEFIRDRPA